LLHKEEDAEQLERWAKELERRSLLPPRLQWEELVSDVPSDGVPGVALSNALNVMSCSVSENCAEPDDASVG
jgi:hypothetical protein